MFFIYAYTLHRKATLNDGKVKPMVLACKTIGIAL